MRNKLIAAFAFTTALVSTGAASAADLGARYTKAPAYAEPLFNWTGFYVGGHIGGAWTNEQAINNGIGAPFGDLGPGDSFRQRSSGIMGGAQIGYNWQANNYVFGMEGTISGLDNKGTAVNTTIGAADDVFTWRANVLATVVGRAGFAVQNNLFYVKGGYAGVNNRLNVTDTVGPATGSGGQTHWANGWTVGAGWEYGITRNWIVGLEYNYAAFGGQTYQLGGTSGNYTFDAKPRDIQWAVVRASYKFDGPVIARY
ncbi:outer membrane protein [Bradyrhizobium betae]|uniref:Porin family protein n=1 Tax=Bradyrhizobium betae TaxID=244734 RepID=A0A5P6NXY9_9BRAD|nr:outer membrane beta-barrel protein [Bradyrhizobium betae]MCS3725852.1 outer membrane immunogenic protein [Bradyrhizobium betae]QFI70900.1 porin family protein [Bradyrhizobium betae]QFI77019.1 porin family protein [Bradyrhizobium betae]